MTKIHTFFAWMPVVALTIGGVAGFVLGGIVGCLAGLVVAFIISTWLLDLWNQKEIRRFRHDFEGRWLLVCSRRGQWGQFIDNNVLTVLPEEVHVVWCKRSSKEAYPASALRLLGLCNVVERPYLIRYISREPEIYRLHEKLVELSHTTRHDQQVASSVRSVLQEIMTCG